MAEKASGDQVSPEQSSPDQFSAAEPDRPATPRRAAARRRSSTPGSPARWTSAPTTASDTYRGSGRLAGKKAVITGGDSGIGRAVALAFAREGADVLITYLPEEEEDAQETAALVEEAGRAAVTVPGDMREEQRAARSSTGRCATLGGIDVLVSNAAYQMSQDDGILGHHHRAARPGDQDQPLRAVLAVQGRRSRTWRRVGSIITTSSVQAFDPSPHLLDYATTKAGIVNFTKGLAAQLAEKGIRVNSVAPGPGVDAADPGDDGRGEGGDVRRADAAGPGGAAGRAGAVLRVPGLAGVELHDRARCSP